MKNKFLALCLVIMGTLIFTSCGLLGSSDTDIPEISNSTLQKITNNAYAYSDQHNIGLLDFSSEIKAIDKWLNDPDGEGFDSPVYLQGEDAILSESTQFKRSQSGRYRYFGEMDDNYPDGMGLLLLGSDSELSDLESSIVYIGEFKNGYFSGFGMSFGRYYVGSDAVMGLVYEGEFSKGLKDGNGNYYNGENVYCGSFKSADMDGSGKLYSDGFLFYNGEWNKGKREGEGTAYYPKSGQIKYEGDWKNDEYHGSGTLYDINGDIIYEGKWANGEYK